MLPLICSQNFDLHAERDDGSCQFPDFNASQVSVDAFESLQLDFDKFQSQTEALRRKSAVEVSNANLFLSRASHFVPDEGQECFKNSTCISGLCKEKACSAPSCSDRIKNFAFETDIDCGGPLCPGDCQPGAMCDINTDCDFNGTCLNGTCRVDFGFPCQFDQHCLSEHCDPGPLTCTYIKECFNAVQDGNESDVDCGGKDCAPCAIGLECVFDSDCKSGECLALRCVEATPSPSPSSSVSATPSVTASTTTTATEGTSPTPTSSVSATVTSTGTPSRSPGPTIILSLFAPKFPRFHDGIFGSSRFIVMALFNIEIDNPNIGPSDFSTTCIDIDENSWIEIRANLSYSFTAHIVGNCPRDAVLTLPRFAAGPTHDISEQLVSRFTGAISPTPTPTSAVTPSITATSSVTGTASPSLPPLSVELVAMESEYDSRLSFDPLSFLLKSSHHIVDLGGSAFSISVDGVSSGQERVRTIQKLDDGNDWLIKLEHLRYGKITLTLHANSIHDDRGVALTESIAASAWYDGEAPEGEVHAPVGMNELWKLPAMDLLMNFSEPIFVNIDFPRPNNANRRSLHHADPTLAFKNAELVWLAPLFCGNGGFEYVDGRRVYLESEQLQSWLSFENCEEDRRIFHARINVSFVKEAVVELEFLPRLFQDGAGNSPMQSLFFSFVKDILPPILDVEHIGFSFPSATFNLSGHEKFSFVSGSLIEYRGCDNEMVCSEEAVVDKDQTESLGTSEFRMSQTLFANLASAEDVSFIAVYVGENALRDQYNNTNPSTIFGSKTSVLNLDKWPLRLFGDGEESDKRVVITVFLKQTPLGFLVEPILSQFIEAAVSASNVFSLETLLVRNLQSMSAGTEIVLVHQNTQTRQLKEASKEESGLPRTKEDIETRIRRDLENNLPSDLLEAGIVNRTDFVNIDRVEAVGYPDFIEPGAAVQEEISDSVIASTGILGSLLLIILVLIGVIVFMKKRKASQRRKRYVDEEHHHTESSTAGANGRVIDDATPVGNMTEHGSALKDDFARDPDSEDESEDRDFECNLREETFHEGGDTAREDTAVSAWT